ncbi:hypothetical protein MXB_1346 [Myxobolus squamalis]|nr:hypothetical protein MXB_1346 [Myxobolus squamalis]
MIGYLIDLLRCVTFNKRAAINMVINKFGDPDNRVSAHAQTLLHRMLNSKTQDNMLIVGEVCAFLIRPNLGFKPRYYSVCFLNQIMLNNQQPEVANTLNFNFEEDNRNKMAESILTGISRAMPYTKGNKLNLNL